jgi:hypothetical protein
MVMPEFASSESGAWGVSVGPVIVYGIASAVSQDVSEFFRTEEEARVALERVWADAPDLKNVLWIEPVELGQESPN